MIVVFCCLLLMAVFVATDDPGKAVTSAVKAFREQ